MFRFIVDCDVSGICRPLSSYIKRSEEVRRAANWGRQGEYLTAG